MAVADNRQQEAEAVTQLVDLAKLDYDSTLRALNGFVTTGGQIRAIGIAAWGVVLGLAANAESFALAGLAAVLIAVFAYADAYHAVLYRRALGRSLELEKLLGAWGDSLGINSRDEREVASVRANLEMHRFGMQRSIRPPIARDMVNARPLPVFRFIYPSLFVAAVVTTIVLATAGG